MTAIGTCELRLAKPGDARLLARAEEDVQRLARLIFSDLREERRAVALQGGQALLGRNARLELLEEGLPRAAAQRPVCGRHDHQAVADPGRGGGDAPIELGLPIPVPVKFSELPAAV